jgi:hypothetical protein
MISLKLLRIYSFSLCLILVVLTVGYRPFVSVGRLVLKGYVSLKMSDKNVKNSQFIFKRKDIKAICWMENHKEFTYQGKMYDIISKKTTDSVVTFNCFSDNGETEFCERASALLKKESKNRMDLEIVIKFCSLIFTKPVNLCIQFTLLKKSKAVAGEFLPTISKQIYLPCISPPPWY